MFVTFHEILLEYHWYKISRFMQNLFHHFSSVISLQYLLLSQEYSYARRRYVF